MENSEVNTNTNDNFYQPVEVNGQTENLIKDSNAAQELAEIAKPGIDAALSREQELKEGLTETEKENIQIMEALLIKYQNSFKKEIDEEGRKYLIFKGYDRNNDKDISGGHIVLSQDGLIRIEDEKYKSALSRTNGKLTSGFVFEKSYPGIVFLEPGDKYNREYCVIEDLRKSSISREDSKIRFSEYEEAHKDDVEPKELTTQDIIDSL